METVTTPKWRVDLNNLTCYNLENHMVIVFVKKGPTFVGKIKDIPFELVRKWANDLNGEKNLRNAVIEADAVFFKAYFEREMKSNADRHFLS